MRKKNMQEEEDKKMQQGLKEREREKKMQPEMQHEL